MSAKPNNTETSLSAPSTSSLSVFAPDPKIQPVALSGILQAMGLSGPRVPASELIDQSFIIVGAKPFSSAFAVDAHAWFCVCRAPETGEVFTTVLGGQAVVDIIDALTRSGFSSPILVTLKQVAGGRFGRYYVLE